MSNEAIQVTAFNQSVNYGKQWRRWQKIGTSAVLVRELCRNQSGIVTVVSEFMFEQYKSPFYFTYEVDAIELFTSDKFNA